MLFTHRGWRTHIYISKLSIIGSDNGSSPGRRQAIIWTNAGILLIGPLGTNFSEILIGIQIFSTMEMQLKMTSAKWRPFRVGLNELIKWARRGSRLRQKGGKSSCDHSRCSKTTPMILLQYTMMKMMWRKSPFQRYCAREKGIWHLHDMNNIWYRWNVYHFKSLTGYDQIYVTIHQEFCSHLVKPIWSVTIS